MKYKILLVEDDAVIADQIGKQLEKWEYVHNGLALYQRFRYDNIGKEVPEYMLFLQFESRSSMYLARSKHTKYFLLRIAIIADVLI